MRALVPSRLPFAAATIAAILAAACSAPPPTATSSSASLVVDPSGNEDESHVVIALPNDACLPGASCAKVLGQATAIFLDGAVVAIGADTRLEPGAHQVTVNNLGYSVTTTGGQTLTLVLPIADRKCTATALPNVPQTDFGGSVTVANALCPTTATGAVAMTASNALPGLYYDGVCGNLSSGVGVGNCSSYGAYSWSYKTTAGTCVNEGLGVAACAAAATAVAGASAGASQIVTPLTDAFEAYLPGTLNVTVNGAVQSLTLAAGDEADFDISLPVLGSVPATFATGITFLAPRTNPDAARGTITSSCVGDRSYTLPASSLTSTTPAPLALTAFVNGACTYTLNVGGRATVLSQTQANAISLDRLDVNNVTITREDGSTYATTGTYTLNYGGVQVAGPYSTGTGIDVLTGTYQLSVSFTDFDGPKTQTQTVNL